jgi:hypothetical protein
LHQRVSQLETFVGPSPAAKAVQTEFGNSHQAPKPHLRPAFDGKWREALGVIIDVASDGVERVRQKYAREAQKRIANMRK